MGTFATVRIAFDVSPASMVDDKPARIIYLRILAIVITGSGDRDHPVLT